MNSQDPAKALADNEDGFDAQHEMGGAKTHANDSSRNSKLN